MACLTDIKTHTVRRRRSRRPQTREVMVGVLCWLAWAA